MGCCQSIETANSWIQWQKATPVSILDLVANAKLNNITGIYSNESDFATQTWAASPITYQGTTLPTCSTLHTDNQQMVANAEQWNMQHLTRNVASTLAIPLQKVIFLRGGTHWQMTIPLNLSATLQKVELGFRDNAGTRGDGQSTYPVITFTNGGTGFSGNINLVVTLKQMGNFSMLLWGTTGAAFSTFESEWIIVP